MVLPKLRRQDLSGDGGVQKRLLQSGHGSTVPTGDSSTVVRATVQSAEVTATGSLVDEGLHEILLGRGQISRGFDLAVASMREGEKALVLLDSSYAPRNANMSFQVEVLKFELLDANMAGGRQALEDLPEAPAEAEEAPAVTAAPPSLVLGETVKMDHLGPVIVNADGSLRRIANWQEMTEVERRATLRRIARRNQQRLARLEEGEL